MFARSMWGREDWTRIENTIPFVRHSMHPAIAAIEGNLGLCMLVSLRDRRFVVISGWESEPAMHASDPTVAPLRAEAARLLGGRPEVEEWEVAALRRTGRVHPGHWVSVARKGTDPAGLDKVVDAFRGTVLPAAERHRGFRSALLLVDRDEGRIASAVTFDGYTSLHAAHRKGAQIHDLSAVGLTIGASDVTDYELEIAEMRLPESI